MASFHPDHETHLMEEFEDHARRLGVSSTAFSSFRDTGDALMFGQKSELGPYAYQDQMPNRIMRIVESESPKNKVLGVIPALAKLLDDNVEVESAYLCHSSAIQISKLAGEGQHFCAYRNIQMLLPDPPHPLYSILALQGLIETAWDQGFNSYCRVETGGIKGTRKHIGSAEVG